MVEFRHVTKTYPRTHTHALKDVDFQIAKGEFVYVTGHSGAGKSTLLSLMLRRVVASEGTVSVGGQDVARLAESRLPLLRRSIGMIFQDHRLLGHLSALDNLMFALRATQARGNHEQRAMTVLRQVGLVHKRKAYPIELSLGEQQRVAIARAMVTDAPLLLADEPTGNLDRHTAEAVFDLMLALNESHRTSFVIVTHDLHLAAKAQRTLTLDDGVLAGA